MTEGVTVGLTATTKIQIDRTRCIDHMGDELAVYATPRMIGDVELACHELIDTHIGDGQSTVGTHVDIHHLAPSLEGDTVEITTTVTKADGRAVTFEATVRDSIEEVGRGKHSRFIVDQDKTLARLTAKREQLNSG